MLRILSIAFDNHTPWYRLLCVFARLASARAWVDIDLVASLHQPENSIRLAKVEYNSRSKSIDCSIVPGNFPAKSNVRLQVTRCLQLARTTSRLILLSSIAR
ncbi:hypothetical protein ACMFMG_006783 [Clarireedia jacksonii]